MPVHLKSRNSIRVRCVNLGVIVAFLGIAATTASTVLAQAAAAPGKSFDWPQFLGPHRNGISDETGLLDKWPADGPKEVWRVNGGVGMSAIVVSRGTVITMVQDQESQYLLALDAMTGKEKWKVSVGKAYKNSMGDGPRATPAVEGDTVYAFSGDGILTAHRFDDGEILWKNNTVSLLGGKIADYGMACSPLVTGDMVIVTVGAPGAAVAAYHRKTGKLAWRSGSDNAGYSSPALLKVGGQQQVVVLTGGLALGLSTAKGETLWQYPFKTNFDCNVATPLADKGRVFISAGENHGCALLSFQKDGEKFKVSDVWTSKGAASVMRNGWQTSIIHDGHLYGMDNVGAATSLTHLNCINIETGKLVWQQKRFGNGNLIAADGKLILTTMKGELVFAKLTTKGYSEIGRKTVVGKTRQSAALSNGYLFLRDDRQIVCLDANQR